jgi:DNA-binding NtrC family response regulator
VELLAQRPALKVLYVSGHVDETIGPLALAGANTAFVQKPFTHDGLASAVRELLDRKDAPIRRAVGSYPHR